MTGPTLAERYAGFAAGLRLEDVPPALIEKAALHILDTVGCAIAASPSDYAAVKFAALRRLDGGSGSTAIGQNRTLGLRDAILFNGGLANALDYDDTYTPNLNHISGGTVPLVLGLGAREGATGQEIIAAYLIAMEVATHIGLGVPGNAVMRRGFSTSGTLNGFANALAAGRLLKLPPEKLAAAQGVVLTLTGGAMEGLREGAWSKRLNAGLGAVSGLTAAMMAAEGMSGPSRPYEGDLGLYRMLLGPDVAVDWDAMTGGLGVKWEFARVAIKAFPLVHHAHNIVDAAIRLHREDGVRPDDVESITALVTDHQVPLLCQPETQRRHPPNDYAAIFSVYHLIATALTRGRMTLEECEGDALHDPVIRGLRDRVSYEIDPDSLFPEYFSGGLVARLRDGRTIRHYDRHHFSSDKRPMPSETIVEKFRNNAGRVYPDNRVDAIIAAVMALRDGGSPQAVTDLLGAA